MWFSQGVRGLGPKLGGLGDVSSDNYMFTCGCRYRKKLAAYLWGSFRPEDCGAFRIIGWHATVVIDENCNAMKKKQMSMTLDRRGKATMILILMTAEVMLTCC